MIGFLFILKWYDEMKKRRIYNLYCDGYLFAKCLYWYELVNMIIKYKRIYGEFGYKPKFTYWKVTQRKGE